MNRLCQLSTRLALALSITAAVLAGCNSSRDARRGDSQPAPTSAADVRRAQQAAPAPARTLAAPQAAEDRTVGPGLTALRPVRDGALIVVPIVADAPARSPRFLTLDEGMRRGLVSVRELPETDYGQLRVSNRSDQTLCVMAGEVILDGHQDRTFAESLAFAPREREDVPVRCVEPDRDDGPSRSFVSAKAMVHSELRREIYQGTQSSVWEEVRRYNRAHELRNETSTYRTAAAQQSTGPQQAWRQRVLAALQALPERDRLVGVAVALEGRLISVDLFATPELYGAMEPKLLGSFVAQAADSTRELRTPRPAEIRDLLAGARGNECGQTAVAPAVEKTAQR